MTARTDALLKIMERRGLDAILVRSVPNVRYLSGFTSTEPDGAVIAAAGRLLFLTDSRYEAQVADEVKGFEIRIAPDLADNIVETLGSLGVKKIGYEDHVVSVAQLRFMQAGVGSAAFEGVDKDVESLRLHKDPDEIAVLRQAAWAAEIGFQNALKAVRPGVSEVELAIELEFGMRRAGAQKPSFDLIVASGPRGALPHGVASEKRVREGEFIVFDFGCVLGGYCSDQTVTVAVGDVGEEERKVYEIVREAQALALEALKPGVALRDVDAVARDVITRAGYGPNFGHGLGHGVGLEIHEAPRLSKKSDFTAEPGMVVTVEPGIYLTGRFGVRIEDTVVITSTGFDRLTTIDKGFLRV